MTLVLERLKPKFTAEGGGWLVARVAVPDAAGKSPAELLENVRSLPGNLRYVPAGREVLLLGEVRNLCGSSTVEQSRRRLAGWLHGTTLTDEVTPESLEAALEGSGFAWARRDHGWAVPASDSTPREVSVSIAPGGVRLEAVLADWDEPSEPCLAAIASFLLAAHESIRAVRCHIDGSRAVVIARAESAHLEADVLHGLQGIATACRLLAREAAALLAPEVARAYLDFRARERWS